MSLDAGYESLDVKKYGYKTTVPYNNLAKLMYYLKCVFAVIEVDYKGKLTDYENCYNLSRMKMEYIAI